MRTWVGADVSATSIHGVEIDRGGSVVDVCEIGADELFRFVDWARRAEVVAVDAPAQLSMGAHRSDPELAPKYRAARCAEIALGREHRVWVPWVAPEACPEAGWIRVGLRLFAELRDAGRDAIEVFPYAGFRLLAGGSPLPKKTSRAGRARRIELLGQAGIRERTMAAWGHDALDAALAALIAQGASLGGSFRVGCGHDDSAIWLPSKLHVAPT